VEADDGGGMTAPDLESVRRFIEHEARLLDENRWDDWNALFTDDGIYWMPAAPGQPDALDHVSLIHDTPLLRRVRIERFANPNAFSLQPRPRAARIVSGIAIDSCDPNGVVVTRSALFAAQYGGDRQTVFAGHVIHHLVIHGGTFRIRLNRVDLINCDGVLNDIHFYL
jgi:benzoate/toluate 1,2-dioxygenase beta subunit